MSGQLCVNFDFDYRLNGDKWDKSATPHNVPAPTNTPGAIFITETSKRRVALTLSVPCDDAGNVSSADSLLASQRADSWFELLKGNAPRIG